MGDQDVNTGHLFAQIQAPKIKSISRKAMQDFLADREAYEDLVAAQRGISAVPYRSCFTASYLKSLIRARFFGAEIAVVSELTDELIKSKLEKVAGTSRSASVESAIADVKRNVELDSNEPDARLRIVMLSASYLELCGKRASNFVENSRKEGIKHIIFVVQPPRLKSRLEDALQLERADLKKDYFRFMDFLADKSEVFEEVQTLRECLDSRKRGNEKSRNPSKRLADSPKFTSSSGSSSISRATNASKKNLPPCLNPSCKENHLVKDSPKHTKNTLKHYWIDIELKIGMRRNLPYPT